MEKNIRSQNIAKTDCREKVSLPPNKSITLSLIIFLIVISSLLSCKSSDVSTADVKSKAEKAIEMAKSVDADKYAPEELESAEASYDQGVDYMSQNNNLQANNDLSLAYDYATNAYNKSLEPYVEALIEETDVMIEEAEQALKSTALFENTTQLNEEAKTFLNNGDYLAAKEKTLEARESIELAYRNAGEQIITDQRSLQEGERFYRVKYNPEDRDSLWKISERELGSPYIWKQVYNRNNDIIEDPNLIYPDQELILPNVR